MSDDVKTADSSQVQIADVNLAIYTSDIPRVEREVVRLHSAVPVRK